MSSPSPRVDNLIAALTSDLRPVTRLHAPLVRAVVWIAAIVVVGAGMALKADLPGLDSRLALAPDMWLAVVGSALTAILAAIAAFQLSLPDRPARWAFLPLPAVMLWVGASGAGCLRTGPAVGMGAFAPSLDCLVFVVGVSLPLSALLIVMLRRGYTLRPGLTASIGGLAAGAAAATLLNFFHRFDALAADFLVHTAAISLIVGMTGALGSRFFGPRPA